jgi:hypothetical protein
MPAKRQPAPPGRESAKGGGLSELVNPLRVTGYSGIVPSRSIQGTTPLNAHVNTLMASDVR